MHPVNALYIAVAVDYKMSTRYYAIVFKDLTQVVLRVKFRSSFCS